jgi:hypothetical protein
MLTLAENPRLDYINSSFKPFDVDPVTKFSFTSGKEVYELERPADGKSAKDMTWKITAPESLKGRATDSVKISELLLAMAITQPLKIAADRPKEDVLNRLQVDPKTPRAKVTIQHKELGAIVYDFGADAGTDKRNVYLKTGTDNLVYEVDRGIFDRLQKADVQDTVIHRLDQAKVKSIKVKGWQATIGELKTLEFVRKDGKWTLASGGAFEIDPKKVDQFLAELTAPQADKAVVLKTGAKPEHNLDPAKNSVEVELDVETTGKVTIQISPADAMLKVYITSSLAPGDVFQMPDKGGWMRDKPTAFK